MYIYVYMYMHIYVYILIVVNCVLISIFINSINSNHHKFTPVMESIFVSKNDSTSAAYKPDNNVYLRLQHGKKFYYLLYMSYEKHINPASKA
jgi:hypothetical protein